MKYWWLVLLTLVVSGAVGLVAPPPAAAHQTAASTVIVHVRPEMGEVDKLVSLSSVDLAHHLGIVSEDERPSEAQVLTALDRMTSYVADNLRVHNNGTVCEPIEQRLVQDQGLAERLNLMKTSRCEGGLGHVVLENRIMLEAAGGYRHFGRIQVGDEVFSTVFDPRTPTYEMRFEGAPAAGEGVEGDGVASGATVQVEGQGFWKTFGLFLWQGILHIVIGLDHVLFVVCLLLAAPNLRRLLAVVTCFTVGHSVTLVLSALDVFTIAPHIVEPLIALSIAAVALEHLVRTSRNPPAPESAVPAVPPARLGLYLVAGVFGLVHGFGFSYVLRDELGLPTDALVSSLFAFNLGVEVGQVAIVALVFPALVWARTRPWNRRFEQAACALILALSAYWIVARIFFEG